MNWFTRKVTQNNGHILRAVFQFGVSFEHIHPDWEVSFVLWIGGLCHDMESIPHHHCPFSVAVDYLGSKGRDGILSFQHDLLI